MYLCLLLSFAWMSGSSFNECFGLNALLPLLAGSGVVSDIVDVLAHSCISCQFSVIVSLNLKKLTGFGIPSFLRNVPFLEILCIAHLLMNFPVLNNGGRLSYPLTIARAYFSEEKGGRASLGKYPFDNSFSNRVIFIFLN